MIAVEEMAPSLAGVLSEDGWRALVVAVSKDPNAKFTILLFPPGSDIPERAIKAPTTSGAAAALSGEADVLRTLHRRGLGRVSPTVPAVLGKLDTPAGQALLLSGLRGQPLTTAYHRWHHTAREGLVRADFAAAGRWLAAFWESTAWGGTDLDPVSWLLPTLRSRFESHADFEAAWKGLHAIRDRMRGERTPVTAVHGDFWFGNVLVEGGEVSGVLDWEAGMLAGQPVRDLVRFALSYALYLDRHTRPGRTVAGHPGLRAGRFGAGIEFLADGTGWFPDAARTFLMSGLNRLGIPGTLWRDMVLVGAAEVAATADHPDFAAAHLELLVGLMGRQ